MCIGDGRRDIGIGAKMIFQIAKLFISKNMSYYWGTSIGAGYTAGEVRQMLDNTELKDKYEISVDLFDITIHNQLIPYNL